MLESCCPTMRVPGTTQWSRMCSCILNRSCSIGMYAAGGSGRNSAGGGDGEGGKKEWKGVGAISDYVVKCNHVKVLTLTTYYKESTQ